MGIRIKIKIRIRIKRKGEWGNRDALRLALRIEVLEEERIAGGQCPVFPQWQKKLKTFGNWPKKYT